MSPEWWLARPEHLWMERAACRIPTVPLRARRTYANQFFPTGAVSLMTRRACAICPVKQECLEFAIENEIEEGVWGGLSPSQRREVTTK